MENSYNLKLKSGKNVNFKLQSYHYLNPDLNKMFDNEYPTIVALYKRQGVGFKRITVHVISNPKAYFNSQPVSNDLRETVLVLLLNENLPSPADKTIEYLDKLQHEIIESLEIFLEWGHV